MSSFAINTNNDALNTYRNLSNVQNSLSKSLERLSSGLRINQAGDDAAGLTISTQLGSQVSGLQQASRNAQDGTSVVQTADGALSQAQSILGRLRDLAVQAGNDSNSADARTAISTEAKSLTDELKRIGQSVNFNGQNLLDGSKPTFTFQVGAGSDSASQITVDLSSANLVNVSNTLGNGTVSSGEKFTGGDLTKVTGNIDFVSSGTGTSTTATVNFGTAPASYDAMVTTLNGNSAFKATFTASVIKDANGAGIGVLVAAKDGSAVSSTALTTAATGGYTAAAASATTGIQFDSATHAQAAIVAIDAQIANVSSARANIGALENRFNNVVSTISTTVQNLTAAKSRITDVDMASEMVNYTRANVLSQSGTAMLAQANSLPQLALKLLG